MVEFKKKAVNFTDKLTRTINGGEQPKLFRVPDSILFLKEPT
jgi:hypothetical protein